MQFGNWQLSTVQGGRFWIDGGVMYGVVPKAVWNRITPANEKNLIPMATNCVLVQTEKLNLLIDAGPGDKLSPLDRNAHGLEPGSPLMGNLKAHGLSAADIDAVVLSHLHWDHAGGATAYNQNRRLAPAFPRAAYFINRREWNDAMNNSAEFSGAYSPTELLPLETAGQLVLVDDGQEILPGITCLQTGGHCPGHQAFLLESSGETAVYLGDLCPATTHVRRMWCTAYDLDLVETRRRKAELLGRAADDGWRVLWDHDPEVATSRVVRHPQREFTILEPQPQL